MKDKVTYSEMEVIVESENNCVIDITGDAFLKYLIEPNFTKSIAVEVATEGDLVCGSKIVTLKPGDKNYITSVLIQIIQNKLEMTVEYNIS